MVLSRPHSPAAHLDYRPMEPGRPPGTKTLPDDEGFSAATRSDVFAACRKRIVELDGEVLSEIPTGEDND